MPKEQSPLTRRDFLRRHAATAALGGFSILGLSSRADGERKQSFRELIALDIAEGMAHGVVVLAARGGKTLFHEAFGRARTDPAVPMRPDSMFDIASVTKVVATATACAICLDRGLIAIDAPVGRYLQGIEEAGRDILIRDLATHMSGYDNTKNYLAAVLSGADPVAAIQRERPVRKPGEQYRYACINLMLLGLVVEAVTGMRLDEFCERQIFQPLGMHDTHFGPVDGGDPRVVKMLNADPGVISDEPARAARRPLGNAGLFSTTPDLARFAQMLIGRGARDGARIVSPETVSLFKRRLNQPPHHPRAFGWDLAPELRPSNLSDQTYYHTGWTGQSLYIDPGTDAYVVVLSNRTGDHDKAKIQRMDIARAVLAEAGC